MSETKEQPVVESNPGSEPGENEQPKNPAAYGGEEELEEEPAEIHGS
jgi:hypothetical protein